MAKSLVFTTKCLGSFAKYDPDSLSLKTFQTSLPWGDMTYLEPLPLQGMMQNGVLYELGQILVYPISDVDGFVLPTPLAHANNNPHTPSAWDRHSQPCIEYCKAYGLTKEECIENGYKLNPQFVEILMGFPKGWTDAEH